MIPARPISIPYRLSDPDDSRLTHQHPLSDQRFSCPVLSIGERENPQRWFVKNCDNAAESQRLMVGGTV